MFHLPFAVVTVALGLTCGASARSIVPRQESRPTNSSMIFDFADVPVSTDLQWVPCFHEFLCANLLVPLDYEDELVGDTVVAFIQSPSNSSNAEDILTNPGGPGGSGVSFMLTSAPLLRSYFGNTYNIIGFDPRGVNNSGPHLDCFPNAPFVRDIYDQQISRPVVPESNVSLSEAFATIDGLGRWCTEAHKDGKAAYIGTLAVSADMLHFAKLRSNEDDVKVNYYGASYGTVLGTTFAATYPEHVGRFVLDAVSDAEDYYVGGSRENLRQADDIVEAFFGFCFNAKQQCPFFSNDSSPNAMKARFDGILEDINKNPIPFYDPDIVEYPVTVTIGDVRTLLLPTLYDSVGLFPLLAIIAAELEQRNATSLIPATRLGKAPEASCNYDGPLYTDLEPRIMIVCNDAAGRYLLNSVEEWSEHVQYLVSKSSYVGAPWASLGGSCRSYEVRPPPHQVFRGFQYTKTANPILFVRNRLDPVTSSAEKMSAFFEDSVILTRNAVGHGMFVGESNCTMETVKRYFEEGVLPDEGLVCDVEDVPFMTDLTRKPRRSLHARFLSL